MATDEQAGVVGYRLGGSSLVTLTLLVVQLYPDIWQYLSRERVAMLIGIGVALVAVIVLLAKGSASLGWTGFRGKTLWDLLQLLIVPLVLVGIGFLFEMQQAERQEALEQQQQALEDRRAKAERALAEERAQDEALQAYLDEMGTLLLAKDGLRESEEGSEERTLARARTITVLGRLDPNRKASVMQFLGEAELIQRVEGRESIIRLIGADLSDADLSGTNLRDANLRGADLIDVNLQPVLLSDAFLIDDYLSGANLSYAILSGTAGVTKRELEQQLEQQVKLLRGTTMPDGTVLSGTFEPALAISLSDDWRRIAEAETTDVIVIETGAEGSQLLFANPRQVFDPSNLSEANKLPAPENATEWVSWLQSHPNLDTSMPLPVSVGSASGKQIDVTVTSTPENYPRDHCKQPCAPLYPLSNEAMIAGVEGFKFWFIIVDVGGETVLIDVAAPTDKFDESLPKAEKVLDSVEWIGG